MEVGVPRDREGTFELVIMKTRQRRPSGVDEMVLSLYAKDLTTWETSAQFAGIYGASVSRETVSRIADWVLEEMISGYSPSPLKAHSGLARIGFVTFSIRKPAASAPT